MRVGRVIGQDFKYWKGKASVVFLVLGCNMRCPYCFTSDYVKGSMPATDWKQGFDSAKRSTTSAVITGGEPLVQEHLSIFCKKMKLAKLQVRIETNGSKPELIRELLNRKVVDSIALDVKAPFKDYPSITQSSIDPAKVRESIAIVQQSGIDHELRTTWTPDLTEEQVLDTARQCSGSTWVLQAFSPNNCLNPLYSSKPQTDYETLKQTAAKAEGPSEARTRSDRGEEKVK